MNKTTYTIVRFNVNNDFYVEATPIVSLYDEEIVEFVLCMKNYGLKSFMFGLYKKDCPEETWEKMIENNIEEHIALFYKNMYNVELGRKIVCTRN